MGKQRETFDFDRPAHGDVSPGSAKDQFHRNARAQLKRLATSLGLGAGAYDIRSNHAGPACSGEVTLHADQLYVQASQNGIGLLFRSCKSRRDFTGGPNNWARLADLNAPDDLARIIASRVPTRSKTAED
jgi:hypothetical protein